MREKKRVSSDEVIETAKRGIIDESVLYRSIEELARGNFRETQEESGHAPGRPPSRAQAARKRRRTPTRSGTPD